MEGNVLSKIQFAAVFNDYRRAFTLFFVYNAHRLYTKLFNYNLSHESVPSKDAHANASRKKDKYDIDSYTVCLLATDTEDVNSYKVIKFNPCSKYEEKIAGQLPNQHDCAMASLEGKVQQLQLLVIAC